MAVATPATSVIAKSTAFDTPKVLGSAGIETLAKALDNTHLLYLDWCPPVADFCPITVASTSHSFTVPIQPSLDGLRYQFKLTIYSSFTGNVTVTVQESATFTGVFANVVAPTAVAVTAGNRVAATFTGTIPATSRVLRLSLASGAGNNYYPEHFLAQPLPDSTVVPFVNPWGVTASGFRVFDDALLRGGAGIPVNTEYHDRCLHNTRAIVRDRQQCVFSLVFEDGVGRPPVFYAPPTASAWATATDFMRLGHSRCYIPHTGPAYIDVRSLALVDAGAVTDRVKVSVVGGQTVTLDTGRTAAPAVAVGVETARLKVNGPTFDITVSSAATAGNKTYTYAVVGLWRPGDQT